MDATNFYNDKPEVAEKFEYMEDISQVTVASSIQSQQTKHYLAKSGGTQKRAFVPTVPKPFKFHTESRANSRNKENSPKSPFIPLALSVKQFLENPTRFDTKSSKVRSNTLTVPKSPFLRTKYRSKSTTILPTEEREISEMRGYRFKANQLDQLDRKIFENRNCGIPKVQKPKPTEPYSPAITKPKPPRTKGPSPPHVVKANMSITLFVTNNADKTVCLATFKAFRFFIRTDQIVNCRLVVFFLGNKVLSP
ncbi:hypothetical protein RhiirA5_355936 [Rhizophagus irregularis]|uniref:TPX2 central domain-containing protein n=1 Tax=Rhizophagus irregularis TaxID=588596 RepID=A0A2N0PTD4_9GLOM|nr:hypothetical protein RhiirA5_355936 [Rhizophagus irregularis]